MFGRDKGSRLRVDTLVGATARISGDVEFEGGLHVDGRIHGNVLARGSAAATLSVGAQGLIEGDVEACDVLLNGTVRGDIRATGKVVLGGTARVTGTVWYAVIESAAGAEINGLLVPAKAAVALPAAVEPPQASGSAA